MRRSLHQPPKVDAPHGDGRRSGAVGRGTELAHPAIPQVRGGNPPRRIPATRDLLTWMTGFAERDDGTPSRSRRRRAVEDLHAHTPSPTTTSRGGRGRAADPDRK